MLRKIARIFIILVIIYIAWSIFINLTNLHTRISDDALIPCLFYLPPIGFLAIGFIIAKIVQALTAWFFIKRKKRNEGHLK